MWKKRIAFVLFYITLFFLPPGLITVFLIPPEAQPVFLSGLGNGQATFEADGEVSSGHSPPPTPSAAPAVTPTLTPSRNPTLSPIPSPTPSRNPTPSPIPSPTPSPAPSRVRLAFTGDLMVHDRQLENAYHRETDTYTFSDFVEIADYLQNADYTVGNLETTFADKDAGYGTYPLFNTPDAFADAIAEAGFDFVTTANNHCFDKREKGLIRTLEILDEHGIDHAGTYAKEVYSRRIFVKYISGIRFAFLSYTYSTNGIPVTEGKPWLVNMLDETLIRAQIEKARRVADVVVVLPHMGNEYEEKPSARFVSLARSFCEWGADAVMASHPHVLQPPEFYTFTEEDGNERTSFIAYSMGNFTSGQRTAPRDAGGIFYLEYEKPNTQAEAELKRVSFTSTWVRFTDARGKFDIKVLPVYEALRDTEAGGRYNLRGQDLDRLRNVHRETTGKMLGAPLPIEEIKPEYALNKIYRRY